MGGCEIPHTDPSATPLASNAPGYNAKAFCTRVTCHTCGADAARILRPGGRLGMVFWQDRGDYLAHFDAIGGLLPPADDTAAYQPARPRVAT